MRFKRTMSLLASTAVSISCFAELPFAAFADETTVYSYTYDNYTVSYSITDSWDQSDNISVTISNTGDEAIENWMLYYEDFSADFTDIWNAAVVETEPGMFYVRNAGYNAIIEPDSSVTFGCVANGADRIPSEILMQQTRVSKNSEDYDVSLHINSDWGEAFNGEIVLRNNSDKPLEWWEMDFSTNYTITNVLSSWSAVSTELGDASYRFKGTYSGIIPPQSEAVLGFTGRKNENQDAPQITVNDLTEVIFGGYPEHIDIDAERQAERDHIESLNQDSEYGTDIQSNDDGTVNSIDGKFSEVTVVDAESALESLGDVRYLLGLRDINAQLELESIFRSELADYNTFYFNEVYHGVKVYGRTVTVVARKDGTVLSLASSFLDIPEMNTAPVISAAEAAAANGADEAELTIYSFGDYEEEPVLAYIMNNSENIVICSAADGAELAAIPNLLPTLAPEEAEEDPEDIFAETLSTSSKYDTEGNLVWQYGRFGGVSEQNQTKELQLSEEEKDLLKANNNDIRFKFAHQTHSYMQQNVIGDIFDRNQYIDEHPGSKAVNDLNYNYNNGNRWYVDVLLQVYSFDQIYKDYLVYGRKVALTLNDKGNSIMMDSNILSEDELKKISVPASASGFISSNAAIQSVLNKKGIVNTDNRVELEGNSLNNEKPVIYSWETEENDYSIEPVFAYMVLDKVGEKTYVVDAENGDILLETALGKGLSEPVNIDYLTAEPMHLEYFSATHSSDGYMMHAVKINDKHTPAFENTVTARINYSPIVSNTSFFYEPEAVTGFKTMLNVYDFYEKEYKHSSLDNNRHGTATAIYINIKEHTWVGAAASAGPNYENYYSRGAGLTTYAGNEFSQTHEYDHFLFREYNIASRSGYTNACINEGYSDLFAFLHMGWVNRGWPFKLPNFNVDFTSSSLQYLLDAGKISSGFGHAADPYLTYPAYLMQSHKNAAGEADGLTNNEVGNLYHVSLTMGKYNNKANFNSIRVNVLKAAKTLGFDDHKMAVIREALDYVWQYDYKEYFAKIHLSELGNSAASISNATITLKKSVDSAALVSRNDDAFVYQIEPGIFYNIEVSAPGYLTYRDRVHMYYKETNHVYIDLIKETYNDNGSLKNGVAKLRAIDKITRQPSGAIFQFRTYNENFGLETVCDDNGNPISVMADSETGLTEVFDFAPGYYYPYALHCDNHFIQPMIKIPSGNTTPYMTHTFYDTNFDGENSSIFYDIHVDEFNESTTNFSIINSLDVESDEPTYEGISGESNYGRSLYLLFYKPETSADFKVTIKLSTSQILTLQSILIEEGSLVMDYSTNKYVINPNLDNPLQPHPSYYNFDVVSKPYFGTVQKQQTISGLELYQSIQENGEFVLYTLHADSEGNLTIT